MRIKNKILVSFLSIAIIAIISVLFAAMLGFFSARGVLLRNSTTQLETLAELKAKTIQTFFDALGGDVAVAQDYYNIKTNLPIVTKFSKDRTHPDFIKAEEMLDGQLNKWLKIKEYVNDIMLVDPEGKIVYSANKEEQDMDLDNVLPDPGRKAFEEGRKGIFISQIFRSPNEGYGYKFGLIVTAPIFDFEKQFIGVVAFEINMGPIYKFIQDTTGLGKTGETLVVRKEGDHVLFLSPLRHDPDAALKRKAKFGDKSSIPAQEAANGRTGSGIVIDYRNKVVLSAWRYIPTLDWGIVAKIELQEVSAHVSTLRNQVAIFCFVIIVLVVIASLVMAESISGPIHMLHKGTEIVGSGNLDYKVGIDTEDEIGQLSRSFDQMAGNLKGVQDKLVRSEKLAALGKLAGIVSHELRNPLGAIRNSVYFLRLKLNTASQDEKIKRHLEMLEQEVSNSDRIIGDILFFSHTKQPIVTQNDLNEILEASLKKVIISPNIKVDTELTELPLIPSDKGQLMQVFINIILNAVESMPEGGRLFIASSVKQDRDFASVRIKDTGEGISKENLPKLFEPLFSTKINGTGLGMVVCKSIIDNHKGYIRVESEEGKGTLVTVELPIR